MPEPDWLEWRADGSVVLRSPTKMPQAIAYLWNPVLMMQMNCRGYAVAQFMQPEPARYARGPVLEATTFMQPEQPCYTDHPGRFFYVKDDVSGSYFSVPYEPVRRQGTSFVFEIRPDQLRWTVGWLDLEVEATLTLSDRLPLERWRVVVRNRSDRKRAVSVYACFPVGYMSWMNQAATYREDLGGVVATSVTPYQQSAEYSRVKTLKDWTALIAEHPPTAWDARRDAFEGSGGMHCPIGVTNACLSNSEAHYEIPIAALQHQFHLDAGGAHELRYGFGAARNDADVRALRADAFGAARRVATEHAPTLAVRTSDPALDHFINTWLPRQVRYHGELNRLTTDPQTRNYLQDHMGMVYVDPAATRSAVLRTLARQDVSGALPDGILLHPAAKHKYINLVPHTDHNVWLPLTLEAYLDETDDYALLNEPVAGPAGEASVRSRVDAAMDCLLEARDARGLSLIGQGDWCDPMNAVGIEGRGVSGWLTLATAFALQRWAAILDRAGVSDSAERFVAGAAACTAAAQKHLWDGEWFARGITDGGRRFGVADDREGSIYLNPQSFALLAGAAEPDQIDRMLRSIAERLVSPFGVQMLAPPYTRMREDIGRLTQKYPGSAENGSVYNHAAAFYVHALHRLGCGDDAFDILRRMLPGPSEEDLVQRGQLPVFIPNYYRGAWPHLPRTAGRSSQLFHTGTVAWVYRSLIEDVFGLRGCRAGLRIAPQLPTSWSQARVVRKFRGRILEVHYRRARGPDLRIVVDGPATVDGQIVRFSGAHDARCRIEIEVPFS